MSTWSSFCDAFATYLIANVAAIASATYHKYARWDPQALIQDGNIHVAIWPESEVSNPETNRSHTLQQVYSVLVWEPSTSEGSRLVADETAAATFLTLHESIRDAIYDDETVAGSWRVWYKGAEFAEEVGQVRVMRLEVEAMQMAQLGTT